MTDTPSHAAEAPAKEPFVIVPTIDGYLQLEARVRVLEEYREAVEHIDVEDAVSADPDRLDRHRKDIDELKRRYNALADIVRLHIAPSTAPASAPALPESPL